MKKQRESVSLAEEACRVREKAGKEELSAGEMLVLACETLSRTYTHEEKGYR
ncbi:MAG: hypothetical protein GF418_17325 [Chitinivibrionales bacterium]|nr:hypothetical protein [Chitinivibrionales bacterium]MBD3397382.1 hypothetical protein [Chitinivibrionales bacterium]